MQVVAAVHDLERLEQRLQQLVELGLAVMVLMSGGGLMLSRELRGLMNDELSRANRRRAISFGFIAGVTAMTALYIAAGSAPVDVRAALRLASMSNTPASTIGWLATKPTVDPSRRPNAVMMFLPKSRPISK